MAIQVTLDDNATWYVQSMIHRGVAAIEESIANCERLEKEARDPDNPCPEWAAETMYNQRVYLQQLLRESKQFIPEELLV